MLERWGVQCSEIKLAASHVSAGFPPGCVSDGSVWQVLLWLGSSSSPVSHVYWGTAVIKLGSTTSCVVAAKILLGHGKCLCWAHQPNGEQVLCPAQLKYVAVQKYSVCGEGEEYPHLSLEASQGKLLENRGQRGLQWDGGTRWNWGKRTREKRLWESRRTDPLLAKQLVSF